MAARSMRHLALVHGVNLDMLGRRPREHYGTLTLAELEERVARYGQDRGFAVGTFQTNHEGVMVEHLHHLAGSDIDAVIVNPGAWTHYSYAVRDALEIFEHPIVEVHLSAIETREEWRRHSVVAEVVAKRISGHGAEGYQEALAYLVGNGDE